MICRLCLKDLSDTINIFDASGVELKIAETVSKHFWFEPRQDDPISTAVCNGCWLKLSDFNQFYQQVDEAHRLLTERYTIKQEKPPKSRNLTRAATATKPASPADMLKCTLLKEEDSSSCSALKFSYDEQHADITKLESSNYEEADDDEDALDDETDCKYDFVDGELYIDDQLDSEAEEKCKVTDALDTTNKSSITQKQKLPRKAKQATNETSSNADNDNDTDEQEQEPDVDWQAPVKRKRGRPSKSNASNAKHNASKDKLAKSKTNIEQKIVEFDTKIAQHMRLSCQICAADAVNFPALTKHMEKEHNTKGFAVCCTKKFYKRSQLVEHINKHLNPELYKCEECNKVFKEKQCLRNHFLIKHQPEEERPHACEFCPKKFAKPYLLEQHRLMHKERTKLCQLCDKGFPNDSLLKAHVKVVHENYGLMCELCAKVLRGPSAYERHQLEHQGTPLPKVQCEQCGSWHKDKYALRKHIRRHNTTGAPHECKICGKIKPNLNALQAHHRMVHDPTRKTYECGVCKKNFKKQVSLKEHMTTHTGETLYRCPHCPKTFNSNANMHSHRKKVHPQEFAETRRLRELEKSNLLDGKRKSIIEIADIKANSSYTTNTDMDTAEASFTIHAAEQPQQQQQILLLKDANNETTHRILIEEQNADDSNDEQDEALWNN